MNWKRYIEEMYTIIQTEKRSKTLQGNLPSFNTIKRAYAAKSAGLHLFQLSKILRKLTILTNFKVQNSVALTSTVRAVQPSPPSSCRAVSSPQIAAPYLLVVPLPCLAPTKLQSVSCLRMYLSRTFLINALVLCCVTLLLLSAIFLKFIHVVPCKHGNKNNQTCTKYLFQGHS